MNKIAIIGISGLFPGSSTMDEFWDNLMQGKDLTGIADKADFGADPSLFYQKEKGIVDKCYSLRGGYIRDFQFNPNGYQLPADYLSKQDKLYQWSLYVAKEALQQSGYLNKEDALKKCGVILGNLSFPTASSHQLLASVYTDTIERELQSILNEPNFKFNKNRNQTPDSEVLTFTPSQIVTEGLGLGGGHYALDAACATSLYAIQLACRDLQLGKSDMMLAGAVCGSDQLFIHMGFSIFHAYAAADSEFTPLDKKSGGLVSSEGAGMVLLKRLEDAERDGDNILAVIGGIGLSNDGRGKFLLSPHPKGQGLAFERAYENNDIKPADTSYLECHATGTPLGDKTELNSIANFFEPYQVQPRLGSVKSNMGHLLTAAGMTGLHKVLLSMQHEQIPPNINLKNPLLSDNEWMGGNQMIDKIEAWNKEDKQAGINSFGFGGTNAHMVVQNYKKGKFQNTASSPTDLTAMAITGMDAHFGDYKSLEDFYQAIYFGKNNFRKIPEGRWKSFERNEQLLKEFGFENGNLPQGGYIDDFDIDLLRYKIQPAEAETLEPQQALILKVADNAIKHAGLDESSNIAVLIAMESELAIHHYLARWDMSWQLEEVLAQSNLELTEEQQEELMTFCKNKLYYREGNQTPSQHTSFVGNIMASRLAALWDFSGPAFTISCGDNAVFKALEVAQNMLSLGEVDAVVVGGVDFSGGIENVLLRNKNYPNFQQNESALTLKSDSFPIGEGAGAVVLKRTDKIESSEKVYAVIDGIQQSDSVDENACQEFTNNSLLERWKASPRCLPSNTLGSVQENIGYTCAASGIASLIKSALCLDKKFIPKGSGSKPWILKNGIEQRAVCVNGLDNIQVKLKERDIIPPPNPLQRGTLSDIPLRRASGFQRNSSAGGGTNAFSLEIISADSQEELLDKLEQLELQNTPQLIENKAKKYQLVLLNKNPNQRKKEIAFFKKQLPTAFQTAKLIQTPAGSYFTTQPLGKEGKVAFVYPGSATAYEGLGREVFQLFPELLASFENRVANLDEYIYSEYLYDNPHPEKFYENAIAMMSTGVFFSTVYTEILQKYFNVQPDLAFGYSMGECSSMWYALGMWEAGESKEFKESPIFKNKYAGRLETLGDHWGISTEEAQAQWKSYILLTPLEEVQSKIANYEKVFISFINTNAEVIISGMKANCLALMNDLDCKFVEVPFQNIIHHDFCRLEEDGLLRMHDFKLNLEKTPSPSSKKSPPDFYSSITQSKIPLDSKLIAKNSVDVCCQTVDFPKIVETVYKEGARIFIEIGAGNTCTNWIKTNLKNKTHLALSINQKGKSDQQAISELLAQLISHGVITDFTFLQNKADTQKTKKSFLKKIIPGNSFEIKAPESLKNIKKRELVLEGSENVYDTFKVSYTSNVSFSKERDSVFTKENIETTTMIKENTSTNTLVKKEVLGENGLRLQNFESGEQLEGKTIVFSQQDLEEFATGKIANVFGEEYSIIDTYKRRVMLPMYPYLLVSRVTGLNGKMGEYKPSTMQTEYDIPYDAWFTTDRQIPWAVSVESGQCDLLLISYLGIDFQNKGDLVYRLLDCTLTFVDDLPFEGQTLRYDISINSFVKNGDNLLFFFSYRCYVEDRLVLKMDGGCAGFFKDEQLEDGNGVVYTGDEIKARLNATKKHFTPLLNTKKTSFSKEDLRHLINGDMEKCFGDISYYANGRNPSLCLPPEKILMIDRITSVDLRGGAYGLGYIVAEKDLQPDDWYFPCHFRDDEVLAGSLQAEGGGNLLRFFMLMLGLQRLTKDARYQPVFDLPQKVRCRKQVTPKDTKLVYKLEIKEIGLIPNPYVIGDLEIISDGVVTVHFENLGLQLREKDNPKYLETTKDVFISPRSEGALMNEKDITTFALDDLSKCFGPEFSVYDGRTVSRQPNTDLQVISRILRIDGERHYFKKPSTIYAEYDVPVDAWYYEQNAHNTMPYSVLMEIALQPCGLLGAYLGSTLKFPDKNLYFRNLDGDGTLHELPEGTDLRGKTLHNKAVLVSSVALGGTILQNYTFEVSVDGKIFYEGKSSFGFFPGDALAQQAGLDNGNEVAPWYESEGLNPQQYMQIKLDSLYGKMKLYKAPADKPHYCLSTDQLNLIDKCIIVKEGGQYGKGYIHSTRFMQPYDWFFTCHFYQDPVMPGSLGVEAILQAMQVFALQQGIGKDLPNPKFVQLNNSHKTVWKYRGQILTDVKEMHLEVHIKSIETINGQLAIIGDAYLWNGKMRIYQVTDLALGILG